MTKNINKSRKALFIHIPKTAGSNMQEVCRVNDVVVNRLNQTWDDVDANHERYLNFYKFVFVRNP